MPGYAVFCIPVLFALTALGLFRANPRSALRWAAVSSGINLGFSAWGATAWVLQAHRGATHLETHVRLGGFSLGLWVDGVTVSMLALVCFIAVVIVAFSKNYLRDEADHQVRFVRWLMATFAAVTALVLAEDLWEIGLAWVATSLSLHQLLTYYSDRPSALIAAHKKFLVSRLADVVLLAAFAILVLELGTSDLPAIHAWAKNIDAYPVSVEIAAVLLVLGAALKSAQLPFHGWLIQVMEAPTPVSALLHAGVVNLGGFLMIRMSPLMVRADFAQTLLVVIGSLTAVIAALVMTTRVSVKVGLAWSTCAQMGFMLIQCGLGAYDLALLHLLAHSLYKAHAFLNSGSAVDAWRVATVKQTKTASGWGRMAISSVFSFSLVLGMTEVFGVQFGKEPALWALLGVLAMALAVYFAEAPVRNLRGAFHLALSGLGVALLYFVWHKLVGALIHVPPRDASLSVWLRIGFVIGSFAVLVFLRSMLRMNPQGRMSQRIYPILFAGLHLDELFTRLTFQVWPAKLRGQEPSVKPVIGTNLLEA